MGGPPNLYDCGFCMGVTVSLICFWVGLVVRLMAYIWDYGLGMQAEQLQSHYLEFKGLRLRV